MAGSEPSAEEISTMENHEVDPPSESTAALEAEADDPRPVGSPDPDEIPSSAVASDHKRKLEVLDQSHKEGDATEEKQAVAVSDSAAPAMDSDVLTDAQTVSEIKVPIAGEDPTDAVHVKRQRTDGETDGSVLGGEHEGQKLEPSVGNGQLPSSGNTQHAPVGDLQTSDTSLSQLTTASRKFEVPNNKVGVLIGKGGETIKVLQSNSGAKIQITRDFEADPKSSTRPVELIGTLESINKAEQLIKDVIAEAEAGGSPALVARGGFGNSQTETEQQELQVPNEKVGMIIGKRGDTIKNLQTRSGARIQLIPQHLPEGDASRERTVRVTGNKKQIEVAKEMIKEVMNQAPGKPSNLSHNQTAFYPRGPSPATQWTARAPPPAQQQQAMSYDYQQRGTYPSQSTQYPPQPYNSYTKQLPPRSGVSTTPNQTGGGYDYYGQGNQVMDTQSPNPNPAPSPSPAPVSYNSYGQPQPSAYGQPAPYTQTAPTTQPSYGYEEPPKFDSQAPGQQYYGQQQPMGSQLSAYPQQQTYSKPAYGNAPQSYGPPRPVDPTYQAPTSYGPPQQQPPYGQSYGPTPGSGDGYTQPLPAGVYQQQGGQGGPAYGQSGQPAPVYQQPINQGGPAYGQSGQPAPVYPQQGTQSGGYGQYPTAQMTYGDQTVANNASYGYQGAPVDAGYGGSSAPNPGYNGSAPVSNQAGYGYVQQQQQQPMYPSYEQQQPAPQQSGYGSYPANAPSGY